jgi:hypothetical protein
VTESKSPGEADATSSDLARPAESPPFGSFDETRNWRIELTLRATPTERLRWLEEAIRFATAAGALPKPR